MQNLKIDGIFTLNANQIVGTVEETPKMAKNTKISKIQQAFQFRRLSREDFLKHRESLSFTEAFSTQILFDPLKPQTFCFSELQFKAIT